MSGTPSDSDLQRIIDRARGGDTRAFEELARREERALFRHAMRIVGTTSDAEDVVQDALLSAWRSISSFQGTSFRAWLFRIATNRALDRLRVRKRRPELPLDPPEGDEELTWAEPAAPGPDLSDLAGDREALVLVEAALGTLPAEQRTALLLRDVEGFAYEEIASITSVEIGTVKSRIHRGRLAVRNALIARGWRGPGG
ncbi:MAG TPA: sigma-70 family RNA polymerase sigma factor [Candidatus Limnocylindria bacterium]|nr:sigma-70 family RNA polymerase sigma factor [Candidatus Limnocylindria bacterium]